MKRESDHARRRHNARLLAGVLMLIVVMPEPSPTLADGDTPDARERFTAVDREIQAIKREILEINQEIASLEEQVRYPARQQLVVFVSLTGNAPVRVNSVSLALDGQVVSRHDYTQSEEAALHEGGIHRIYVGQLGQGVHTVDVTLSGVGADGQQVFSEQTAEIRKDIGRKIMEVSIAAGDKGQEPKFTIHEW